jgi:hypothetical protein
VCLIQYVVFLSFSNLDRSGICSFSCGTVWHACCRFPALLSYSNTYLLLCCLYYLLCVWIGYNVVPQKSNTEILTILNGFILVFICMCYHISKRFCIEQKMLERCGHIWAGNSLDNKWKLWIVQLRAQWLIGQKKKKKERR